MADDEQLARSTHTDGSPCPEGTQSVPADFRPCCAAFGARTLSCYFDIRYEWWEEHDAWFIIIDPTAGGGGLAIAFCPHCGGKLSGNSEEGRWMRL